MAALALMLSAATVRADTVFTNLVPLNSSDPSNVYADVSSSDSSLGSQSVAQSFVPTQDYTLDSVTMALTVRSGTARFRVYLMDDSGGPHSVLEQFADVTDVPPIAYGAPNTVLVSTAHPRLRAHARYWLVAVAVGTNMDGVWQGNVNGDVPSSTTSGPAQTYISFGGATGPWTACACAIPRGAFEIDGTFSPVPDIASLSPSSVVVGSPGFNLVVTGSQFVSGATVSWNGSPLVTTFLSAGQLSAQVPPELLTVAGVVAITVANPSGGAASTPANFTVAATSAPSISSISPGTAVAGGNGFTLTIFGKNFSADVTVHFGTTIFSPLSVTASQILVNIPASAIPAVAGALVTPIQVIQGSGASNSVPFVINMLTGAPLSVASGAVLREGVLGAIYAASLTAVGGMPPYTWAISTQALPPGLTLAADGTISGTPTAGGQFPFSAQVTDKAGNSTLASFVIPIVAGFAPLAITSPATLPAAVPGTAYSQVLSVAGGFPPYTWSIAAGSLPSGLTLSQAGLISGTPQNAGNSVVEVQVIDSAMARTAAVTSVPVGAPAPTRSGVFPQIASGGGWRTTLYLFNPGTAPLDITVKFKDDTGAALSLPFDVTNGGNSQSLSASSVTENVAPNGVLVIDSDTQAAVESSGWAEVTAGGAVTGYGVFHYTASSGVPSVGTVPMQRETLTSFLLPYDCVNGSSEGIALASLVTAVPASLTATVYDEYGQVLDSQPLALATGGHTAFVITDKFPGAITHRGMIEISSSAGALAGFGLRFDATAGITSVQPLQRAQ